MRNILMVCTGNTCRSPMAEALLRQALQQAGLSGFEVTSAGTSAFPGSLASFYAVQAMQERGLDIATHSARRVDEKLIAQADLILTMTRNHLQLLVQRFAQCQAKTDTLGHYATGRDGDVPDPMGMEIDDYRQVAGQLAEYATEAARKIKERMA